MDARLKAGHDDAGWRTHRVGTLYTATLSTSRARNASQASSCAVSTYSSGLWATPIDPGPHTTVGTPRRCWNSPPSVPKLILVVALAPVSDLTKDTTSLSGAVSSAG